jgi:asparagine synthase (glutamine-hydrolysing)
VNAAADRLPLAGKAKSYIEQARTPLPDRLQTYNFLHRHAPGDIFAEAFLEKVDTGYPLELLRENYKLDTDASTLNRMLYLDWQITLADNDLRKVSQTCSLAGVDVSYPMLDDELVALSTRIPSAMKLKGQNLRAFYKDALRGWLPDETIAKKKQGFGLPFGVWMQSEKALQELAYDNLMSIKKHHILNPGFIDELIDLHRSGHAAYYGELIWILTVFELWTKNHPRTDD